MWIPNAEIHCEFQRPIREVKHEATLKRLTESDKLFSDSKGLKCPILLVGVNYDKDALTVERHPTCNIVEAVIQ